MGLDAFNVAPDNKGGRKEKDEEEDTYGREPDGVPFTPENDTEEWWQARLDEIDGILDPAEEKIEELCRITAMHPIPVRIKLENHGLLDTDWDEYVEEYPMYEDDNRIKAHLGIDIQTQRIWNDTYSSRGSGSSTDDSGLSSLVSDAK